MDHIKWLINTGKTLKTTDGKIINIFHFKHQQDEEVISSWAKHFRDHYCSDDDIDDLRRGTGYSRSEYLINVKFPDVSSAPGPSIRSGDFGEILVADYLEYVLNHWVPRIRYCDKASRNESTKGCDIIGFKIFNKKKITSRDLLTIYEAKAKFTGAPKNRLQEAVDDSGKDPRRKAESLNFIKQKLNQKGQSEQASQVERFQNPEDNPYQENFGAVALFSTSCYDEKCLSKTNTKDHPNNGVLNLMVIHGKDMMPLVHKLYERAADEA